MWCNDEDIKNEQRRVLFLDIITDAAGPMGDCVHKGTRGVHKGSMGNIQSKLPREAVRSLLACLNWVLREIQIVNEIKLRPLVRPQDSWSMTLNDKELPSN